MTSLYANARRPQGSWEIPEVRRPLPSSELPQENSPPFEVIFYRPPVGFSASIYFEGQDRESGAPTDLCAGELQTC